MCVKYALLVQFVLLAGISTTICTTSAETSLIPTEATTTEAITAPTETTTVTRTTTTTLTGSCYYEGQWYGNGEDIER